MQGQKVLVAGATGQVALPLTLALAGDNEVWATARFSDAAAHRTLESAGVRCVAVDLVDGNLGELPTDFGYVLNVPYGDSGGWPAVHVAMILGRVPIPVHFYAPSVYNPIHEDDIIAMVPAMLAAASART